MQLKHCQMKLKLWISVVGRSKNGTIFLCYLDMTLMSLQKYMTLLWILCDINLELFQFFSQRVHFILLRLMMKRLLVDRTIILLKFGTWGQAGASSRYGLSYMHFHFICNNFNFFTMDMLMLCCTCILFVHVCHALSYVPVSLLCVALTNLINVCMLVQYFSSSLLRHICLPLSCIPASLSCVIIAIFTVGILMLCCAFSLIMRKLYQDQRIQWLRLVAYFPATRQKLILQQFVVKHAGILLKFKTSLIFISGTQIPQIAKHITTSIENTEIQSSLLTIDSKQWYSKHFYTVKLQGVETGACRHKPKHMHTCHFAGFCCCCCCFLVLIIIASCPCSRCTWGAVFAVTVISAWLFVLKISMRPSTVSSFVSLSPCWRMMFIRTIVAFSDRFPTLTSPLMISLGQFSRQYWPKWTNNSSACLVPQQQLTLALDSPPLYLSQSSPVGRGKVITLIVSEWTHSVVAKLACFWERCVWPGRGTCRAKKDSSHAARVLTNQ